MRSAVVFKPERKLQLGFNGTFCTKWLRLYVVSRRNNEIVHLEIMQTRDVVNLDEEWEQQVEISAADDRQSACRNKYSGLTSVSEMCRNNPIHFCALYLRLLLSRDSVMFAA